MTATLPTQTVAEWVKVFPRQVSECYTSSVTFMKQLTTVAISTIMYLKNVFPNDSYVVEYIGGAKMRILKNNCRDDVAQFLTTALRQAFEALDKKYLQQLAFCFYEDECKIENLIEYYIFEYSYDDGVTMKVNSKSRNNIAHTEYSFENIREKTMNLLRMCVILAQHYQTKLPSSYDFSVRLYYNEDAPADYQAPGYHNAGENDHVINLLQEGLKVGRVKTPFHELTSWCFVKGHIECSSESNPSHVSVLSNEMDFSADGGRVVCPCKKSDFEQNGMLTCQYCNTQQHAACFGKLRVTDDIQHCCTACYDGDRTRVPTDSRLAELESRKRANVSIFRRALHFCSQTPLLCVKDFIEKFCMKKSNAYKLMDVLYTQGIFKINPQLDPTPQKVDIQKVKEVQVNYFHTEEYEIVDRLLAETFSQKSVNDLLSPLVGEGGNLNSNGSNTETNDRSLNERSDNLIEDSTGTNARALKERLEDLRGGSTVHLTDSNNLTLQEYRAALPADDVGAPDAAPAASTRAKRRLHCQSKLSLRRDSKTRRFK